MLLVVVVVNHASTVGDAVHLGHVPGQPLHVRVALRAQLALVDLFPSSCKRFKAHWLVLIEKDQFLFYIPVGVRGAMPLPLVDMVEPGGPVLGCLVFLCMYRLM